MTLNLPFFNPFMDYSFDVVYGFLSNPTSQSYFSYVIFQSSTGLHFILNLWSILSFFCNLSFEMHFFLLPQFTEEMVLPRENCFCTSVKYKLAILGCGYFWFLYSVLLICVYTLSLATPQSWLLYLGNNSWNWPVIPPTLFFHSIVLDNP